MLRVLKFALLLAVPTAASLWQLWSESQKWSSLSPEILSSMWVGQTAKQCCTEAALTPCKLGCAAPPIKCSSNNGNPIYDQCALKGAQCGTCDGGRTNCTCTTPSEYYYPGQKCIFSGDKVICTNPPNTQRCDVTTSRVQIGTTTCNNGVTMCLTQPNPSCSN